ncbi:cupin domain-containing protein [Flammeovirga pacifica]|uniref:Cupin n=1 Tax=Flammeovirga pacifica TaxID=915059 RepID=A0A1S1YZQ9_FLAPC|nr:cupin [Flammeovirga pacifica]OHX66499.1 cupin [Flammeovirga pacifica]
MKTSSILKEVAFDAQKPVINVLFETDFTKEIRIAMHQGTVMKEHKTKFPIVVELVEGKVDFGVNNEILHLTKGDLLALDGSVPHNLEALENSIIRLTLTKYDTSDRVKSVANQ